MSSSDRSARPPSSRASSTVSLAFPLDYLITLTHPLFALLLLVKNHTVPEDLVQRVFGRAENFFNSLSEEEKMTVRTSPLLLPPPTATVALRSLLAEPECRSACLARCQGPKLTNESSPLTSSFPPSDPDPHEQEQRLQGLHGSSFRERRVRPRSLIASSHGNLTDLATPSWIQP